ADSLGNIIDTHMAKRIMTCEPILNNLCCSYQDLNWPIFPSTLKACKMPYLFYETLPKDCGLVKIHAASDNRKHNRTKYHGNTVRVLEADLFIQDKLSCRGLVELDILTHKRKRICDLS